MKRARSFEDFIRDTTGKTADNGIPVDLVNDLENDYGIRLGVFPFTSNEGEFGHILSYMNDNDEEVTAEISHQPYKIEKHIQHDDGYSAEKAYEQHMGANHMLLRHDDPKRLLIGWVVLKGTGAEWHTVKLTSYKAYSSSKGSSETKSMKLPKATEVSNALKTIEEFINIAKTLKDEE